MNLQSCESIILRQRDFKDRDRLITFLARDRGKLSGIAKGVKVITGRGVGAYEPFTRCILHFAEKPSGGLVQIRKCDLLPPHLFLRTDYERFLHFTYLTELVEQSSISASDSEAFFLLLSRGLERAAATSQPELPVLRLEFELDLLGVLGLQPEWKRCVSCGEAIFTREPREAGGAIHLRRRAPHRFDIDAGGLRCPDCAGRGGALLLAPDTLSQFANWRAAALERERPNHAVSSESALSAANGQARESGDARTRSSTASPTEPATLKEHGDAMPGLDEPARHELERAVRAHLLHRLERRPKSLELIEASERLAENVAATVAPAMSP